jgi:hypothetical protein
MMRMLMILAVTKNMRPDDPTFGLEPIRTAGVAGAKTTLRPSRPRHPIGSKARLAMTLMLYTGCRRGDAVLLGPQDIKRGFPTRSRKTGDESR